MKRIHKQLIALFLIFSPFIFGEIDLITTNSPNTDGVDGLGVALGLFLGAPVIAFIGTLFWLITRKSEDADTWFVLGYGMPAAIITLWVLTVTP